AKIGTLLVDIYAVGWVGMWFGLKSNRPGQAVFKTFAFFFLFPQLLFEVVPWALFSPLSFGFAWLIQPLLMIGKDLAFVAWARTRLETRFRAAAAERYAPEAMPWWEFSSVLRHWTQTKWTGLEGEIEPGN